MNCSAQEGPKSVSQQSGWLPQASENLKVDGKAQTGQTHLTFDLKGRGLSGIQGTQCQT